ncbi:hypothetical protein L3V86_09425 [Thiotrichales bacterium 19S11-10]|nr:hypothetical protein [Thiotrichales bacterium 19S11-10]
MNYIEFLNYKSNAINNFPIAFAFSQKQFEEGLKKLGVNESEVVGIGEGGFIRKRDEDDFITLFNHINEKFNDLVLSDKDGSSFIYKMFYYELANHEYCYTNDVTPTLEALGFTLEEVKQDTALKNGLKKALDKYNSETHL